MPTIKQLPAATSVAGADLLPLSQSGYTRSVAVSTLLAGTQSSINLASNTVLGRVSAGSGGPEPVSVGTGLGIQSTSLIATGQDHTSLTLATTLLAGDEVVINSQASPKRLQATQLRSLFSAGSGVQIDTNGVISASGIGTGSLTAATTSTLGGVKIGNGLNIAIDGTLASAFGATAGTAAAGNDSRITGAEQTANKGQPNGYPGLDSTGRIPTALLPASIQGALNYQGTWNASTNSPQLVSSSGQKGFYFTVSVTGTTTLDGISQWNVGDHAAFNGSVWEKLDGVAAEIVSVAGRTGAVTLSVADVSGAASLASPALTGVPTAPTAVAGTNSAQLATTAFVVNSVSAASSSTTPISGVSFSSGSAYAMQTSDRVIDVTANSNNVVAITLPSAPTLWVVYTIIDGSRNAANNNITLSAANSGTINGLPTFALNENADAISLIATTTTTWRIV